MFLNSTTKQHPFRVTATETETRLSQLDDSSLEETPADTTTVDKQVNDFGPMGLQVYS